MDKYPSYKQSGVDWLTEIPKGWRFLRLGVLGVFTTSNIDKKSKPDEGQVKMLNYTDIIKRRNYYPVQFNSNCLMVTTATQSQTEKHNLKKGDMVLLPSSETSADLGYSTLIDFEEENIVHSYHIIRFRPKIEINHFFKKYITNNSQVLQQFSAQGKGTTRKIINLGTFRNIQVILPPLEEQELIARYLDKKTSLIDILVKKNERKIKLLKEQKISLISHYVTKGLNSDVQMRASGIDWIGEIPKGWRISKFKYIANLKTGNSLNDKQKLQYLSTNLKDIPYVSSKDINIDLHSVNLKNGLRIPRLNVPFRVSPKDSFLLVIEGGSAGRKIAFLDQEVCFVNKLCSFQSTESTKYIYYFVQSSNYQNKFKLSISGLIGGVSISSLKNFELPLPPLEEQKLIARYLDKITSQLDEEKSLLLEKIKLLKEYRQSLISSAVTGKFKVTEDAI